MLGPKPINTTHRDVLSQFLKSRRFQLYGPKIDGLTSTCLVTLMKLIQARCSLKVEVLCLN